ncbi:hypothetical protein GH714_043480 [Hevea brasiliensis]|uniref:Zinc finger-XS domain-containing protein n=1 Tax=Hevea brasiliensis TaxID=3981 RepID=A0A6A6K2X8_HEVBR|nr:hypothetical protein GH714_043480 [Hevea brasiliensis]
MSSRGGGGRASTAGGSNNASSRGKNASEVSSPKAEQLGQGVVDISLDDGAWEVMSRKPKNRAGSSAAKPWGFQNSNPKAGGTPIGNTRPQSSNRGSENNYMAPQSVIPPPLEHGWNWQSRAGATVPNISEDDASQKSHETRKNSRWFKKFFQSLDSLTVEEINEPARQWHCPACQGGPGAIDWYRGLQP